MNFAFPLPDRALLRSLRPVLLPGGLLLVIALSVAFGPALPPSLSGLALLGPYAVLGIGVAISLWFNRGRAFVALTSLLIAYVAFSLTRDYAPGFSVRAVFTVTALIVPLNIFLCVTFPERGVSHHHNYRWILVALDELSLMEWIASAGHRPVSGVFWHEVLEHWSLRAPPMPIAGVLFFVMAFAATALRAWLDSDALELRPMDVGIASTLVAFAIACEWGGLTEPRIYGAFMSAAGLVLLASLLQESHRMAFNDPLTGLPGRRALEERLSGLGPMFTLAMVDVDHFKKFNDTHGHDTGDQVLKLVAARLAECRGGGQAYRYGGEEFCMVFPNQRLVDARPNLERLRETIAGYRMAMRSPDRPKDEETGSTQRAPRRRRGANSLSVTVSIGVAERDEVLDQPYAVLKEADKALYRAKQAGRNRVSD